jgi:hypothetical protein
VITDRHAYALAMMRTDIVLCIVQAWLWLHGRDRQIAWRLSFPIMLLAAGWAAYWWFKLRWPG